MAIAAQRAKVVALNEKRDIFMVLDHRNFSIGTGTREVCEFLAELISRAAAPGMAESGPVSQSTSQIRSALRI